MSDDDDDGDGQTDDTFEGRSSPQFEEIPHAFSKTVDKLVETYLDDGEYEMNATGFATVAFLVGACLAVEKRSNTHAPNLVGAEYLKNLPDMKTWKNQSEHN